MILINIKQLIPVMNNDILFMSFRYVEVLAAAAVVVILVVGGGGGGGGAPVVPVTSGQRDSTEPRR